MRRAPDLRRLPDDTRRIHTIRLMHYVISEIVGRTMCYGLMS